MVSPRRRLPPLPKWARGQIAQVAEQIGDDERDGRVEEPQVGERTRIHELDRCVEETDLFQYAESIAKNLSRGHPVMHQQIMRFFEVHSQTLKDGAVVKSDFAPFDCQTNIDALESEAIRIDIRMQKWKSIFDVSAKSNTVIVRNAVNEESAQAPSPPLDSPSSHAEIDMSARRVGVRQPLGAGMPKRAPSVAAATMATSVCGAQDPIPRVDDQHVTKDARVRARAIIDRTRSGAAEFGCAVRDTVKEPYVQVTAASAASGAVVLGASGAATGFVTGGIVGAMLGVVAAPVTLGLSVPIGAAVGSMAGVGTGTTVGATTGFWGGGAMGYRFFQAYRQRVESHGSAVEEKDEEQR